MRPAAPAGERAVASKFDSVRATAATSARRIPGSSAECPASGTMLIRAAGHAAASSNAVQGGQTMS